MSSFLYWIYDGYLLIDQFMDSGGVMLWWIAALTLTMWVLLLERLIYFKGELNDDLASALNRWEKLSERKSWQAHQIRDAIISQVKVKIGSNLNFIQTLVMLAPLLGLMGTVTGMIEVFNILAVTGGGDAKSMAGGVSKATLPTMAGMVAALSGVFAQIYINKIANTQSELLKDRLTFDH